MGSMAFAGKLFVGLVFAADFAVVSLLFLDIARLSSVLL